MNYRIYLNKQDMCDVQTQKKILGIAQFPKRGEPFLMIAVRLSARFPFQWAVTSPVIDIRTIEGINCFEIQTESGASFSISFFGKPIPSNEIEVALLEMLGF